ncbi:MAG: hypothetical protein ABIW96_00560 [Polaromonas sp.]
MQVVEKIIGWCALPLLSTVQVVQNNFSRLPGKTVAWVYSGHPGETPLKKPAVLRLAGLFSLQREAAKALSSS